MWGCLRGLRVGMRSKGCRARSDRRNDLVVSQRNKLSASRQHLVHQTYCFIFKRRIILALGLFNVDRIAISFRISCGSGEKRFLPAAAFIATYLSSSDASFIRARSTVDATPDSTCSLESFQ